MTETFAQYLERWLKRSTAQGLNNPLVKMPFKRFRPLDPGEFHSIAAGGTLLIGTNTDPIARNLLRNYQMRLRERGEHCAYISSGAIEIALAGEVDQRRRTTLFPVSLKRASIGSSGDKIKVAVSEDEAWFFNPLLQTKLRDFGLAIPEAFSTEPGQAIAWVRAQLGNRASSVRPDCYVGLFSSQQMVVQQRLADPSVRQALARNPLIQAKIAGVKVAGLELGDNTDDGLEELGIILPCDDHQLRVVQLADKRLSLQVEGPPGTGKSQTIANIVSNAMHRGQTVLLVCDKRAAIVQVEERLNDCGLGPALLNLHDEDLDKRAFLRQATDTFPMQSHSSEWSTQSKYPLEELQSIRKTLNARVRFGQSLAHPALQVAMRDALAGLIQLRKELGGVPSVSVASWQSLSKARLRKLLNSIAQWPDIGPVLANATSIWNKVRLPAFDQNPNAPRELLGQAQKMGTQLENLDEVRDMTRAVGIELPLASDRDVQACLELVRTVIARPPCSPMIVGRPDFNSGILDDLELHWHKQQEIIAKRYPVLLGAAPTLEAETEAQQLLAAEEAFSWDDLSQRAGDHATHQNHLKLIEDKYLRLCDQIGMVYSPLFKVRRAQFEALLALAAPATGIPISWWQPSSFPVLLIEGWSSRLQACIDHQEAGLTPVHFLDLERVASTPRWRHVEAMYEHGFNLVSYCKRFVDDRRCKAALQQAYPAIPHRGFKQWREVTVHAIAAQGKLQSLRTSAETHAVLTRVTENYLSIAHQGTEVASQFLGREDVKRLSQAAALVEQWRQRNDLFEGGDTHWRTFWASPNPRIIGEIKLALEELDTLVLPKGRSDSIEEVLRNLDTKRQRITAFLQCYKRPDGDRTQGVLASFDAQREYVACDKKLAALPKYLALLPDQRADPDWGSLHKLIAWRDRFETECGTQKLDVDSSLWSQLLDGLQSHLNAMRTGYEALDSYFEGNSEDHGPGNPGSAAVLLPLRSMGGTAYELLQQPLAEILDELPRHHLWLEKKRWGEKVSVLPELQDLWTKTLVGEVRPDDAERLFCFNLLHLCQPIAKPQGLELKQMLHSFVEQDTNLASWVLDRLKAQLRQSMYEAAVSFAQSESRLRQLSGMQRIRGTLRELVKLHGDYLLSAKKCWMMSPTSLANLLSGNDESDSGIFGGDAAPFDLVIFDEASQIRVLDGLFSMAFGKQVIIVGDKHQLPPTDFFAGFSDTEQDEELGTSESLLNEFEGVFEEDKTHVMLMSHYRSETPDLIRFSNDWFYSKEPGRPGTGQLEMYPPARVAGIGRRLHYVPNAIYSEVAGRRTNPVEAAEVVKLIELHVREHPKKSLGVVTMNIPQMDLIDGLLQSAPSVVQAFCNDESKFFLRNLETVQGDEMDRIIISLTYGKDSTGHFNAGVLGPIIRAGGERRLNVAITRSRSGMVVVSSLREADLAVSGAQSTGFKCLKALLADLESADQSRNFGIGSRRFQRPMNGVSNVVHCESPFEEQVVEFLENQGFELECQYGDGRFRLDIVIKERGKNILAIECDGASYHSSLVARTRDRAREQILRSRGWRVHRVWSTNWWFYEDQEKQALIDAINAARMQERRPERQSGSPDLGQGRSEPSTLVVPIPLPDTNQPVRSQPVLARPKPAPASPGTQGQSPESAPKREDSDLRPPTVAKGPSIRSGPDLQPIAKDLAGRLREQGFRIIDNRASKGVLWVLGGLETKAKLQQFEANGVHFNFTQGAKATDGRPAWWTSSSA